MPAVGRSGLPAPHAGEGAGEGAAPSLPLPGGFPEAASYPVESYRFILISQGIHPHAVQKNRARHATRKPLHPPNIRRRPGPATHSPGG